jgi:hypothetical protein
VAHDWEVQVFASFFNFLYSIKVRWDGKDNLWWSTSRKEFIVCSFYSVLTCNDDTPFPWNKIWWTKVPLRTTFFAWSATLRKILAMDNLRKRHVLEVNRYCMSKRNEESVGHLLFYCEVACALWNALFWASLDVWFFLKIFEYREKLCFDGLENLRQN